MEVSNRVELSYASRSVSMVGGLAYRKFGDLVAGKGLGRLSPTAYSQLSGDVKARVKLGNQTIATVAYQDLQQDSVASTGMPTGYEAVGQTYRPQRVRP